VLVRSWAPLFALCSIASSCASERVTAPRRDQLPAPVVDIGELDLPELALVVSGFEGHRDIRVARARFEKAVQTIVEDASLAPDPETRARTLLALLHRRLLTSYDARATTLAELLDKGKFNCLSASIIYNLLAERLGLGTAGQLLPTHARSIVRIPKGDGEASIVVETTSPRGFDPSPATQAAILAQVAAPPDRTRRSLVADEGVVVSTMVLIGAMYVNRASIAQESGDLAQAEALFRRAESMPIDELMRNVLRDHRAALLSQLAADDISSGDPLRLARAYRTTFAAVALHPGDPEIRQVAQQNLRAAAERVIARAADRRDEARIDAVVEETATLGLEPHVLAGLHAFALSELARLHVARGDYDRALSAIDRALSERLSAQDNALRGTLEQNLYAALRFAAMTEAKVGNVARGLDLISRLEAVHGLSGEQRREVAQDKLNVWLLAAQQRFETGDHRGAAAIYREAARHFPGDHTIAHNLVAALERVAAPDVGAGRCEAAEELLSEIARIDPSSDYPDHARMRCMVASANERLKAGDLARAAQLLRAAHDRRPKDSIIARNLALVLVRWARSLPCEEARERIVEARALDHQGWNAKDLDLAQCE
jgi:tetratricopeptide (TPR) repeat protein